MRKDYQPEVKPEWGSDVMVDAIRGMGLRYLSLNPGSSYRGLHDSLVNYAGNEMEMLCCPHEKIAVEPGIVLDVLNNEHLKPYGLRFGPVRNQTNTRQARPTRSAASPCLRWTCLECA